MEIVASNVETSAQTKYDAAMRRAEHRDVVPNANFNEGIYENDAFECHVSEDKQKVFIALLGEGKASKKHTTGVPAARANKALKNLHP
jgi:hypothetical protein